MIKNLNVKGDIHIDHNRIYEKTTTTTTTNIGIDEKKNDDSNKGQEEPNLPSIKEFLHRIIDTIVDLLNDLIKLFK